MGLYNFVKYDFECPRCGSVIKEFQTKDGFDLLLVEVPTSEIRHMYTTCDKCDLWIVLNRKPCECKTNFEMDMSSMSGFDRVLSTIGDSESGKEK